MKFAIETTRAIINELYVGDVLQRFGAPVGTQVGLMGDGRIVMWPEAQSWRAIFEPMPADVDDHRAFAEELDKLIQSMARRLGEALGAYPKTGAADEMEYLT